MRLWTSMGDGKMQWKEKGKDVSEEMEKFCYLGAVIGCPLVFFKIG